MGGKEELISRRLRQPNEKLQKSLLPLRMEVKFGFVDDDQCVANIQGEDGKEVREEFALARALQRPRPLS